MKNENHIPDFIKQLQKADGKEVRVGVLGTSDSELATYARANEFGYDFGTHVLPERSFLRTTMAKSSSLKRMVMALFNITKPGQKPDAAFQQVGVVAVGEVQEQIRRGDYTPNAESTIARKGSDKPLIDKGRLIGSISYEVA